MQWDQIILNLPGSSTYDLTLPWLIKWDKVVNTIAGDAVTFVDNVRGSGHSLENAWQVRLQYISCFQYLGIQDATPVFRPPSHKDVGAWAGAIYHIGVDEIWLAVSQEKWDGGRINVAALQSDLQASGGWWNHKTLLRHKGFLVHLSMTAEFIVPFLKGLHLATDSWRPKQDLGAGKCQTISAQEKSFDLVLKSVRGHFSRYFGESIGATRVCT
jgi:hypothetical protein